MNHLDVAVTDNRKAANFVVRLVGERDMKRTIRSLYGSDRAQQIQQSLHPQCLSGIGKDEFYRIRRAEVILPVDAGEFTFYDCAYEELLQALGAINDDSSVPWTMFNDDVQMGFFDIYDQYLHQYPVRSCVLRPGMTKDQVKGLLARRSWQPAREMGQPTPDHGTTQMRPGIADQTANLTSSHNCCMLRSMNTRRDYPRNWRESKRPLAPCVLTDDEEYSVIAYSDFRA